MADKWLEWSMRIQAIAQSGRWYSENKYDLERYAQLQDIAAEIVAHYSDHEFSRVRTFLQGETGYATPKVDVRGVVFRDGRVLLVRETVDGLWSMPGGWADIYLSPSENVVKEVYEESGYRTRATRVLAVYDRSRHEHAADINPFYIYKLFFLCELQGGAPRTGTETSDVGFFDLNALPPLSITRITERQVHRMAALVRSGGVDFD